MVTYTVKIYPKYLLSKGQDLLVRIRDGSNTGQKYLNTNTARLYEYEYSENGKYSNTKTFKMYS